MIFTMNFEKPSIREADQAEHVSEAVETLRHNLRRSGFDEAFQGEAAEHRKEKLDRIAEQLPAIGARLLQRFRALTEEEQLNPGTLTFYVVGGRVRATPIRENTDYDVVIAAEKKLTPFSLKHATITHEQRQKIARALIADIEPIFLALGLQEDYEQGIIEPKGFGEKTPEEIERGDGVLKIIENHS